MNTQVGFQADYGFSLMPDTLTYRLAPSLTPSQMSATSSRSFLISSSNLTTCPSWVGLGAEMPEILACTDGAFVGRQGHRGESRRISSCAGMSSVLQQSFAQRAGQALELRRGIFLSRTVLSMSKCTVSADNAKALV